MYINTTRYQFSHGRIPRGHGSWAFDLEGLDSDGRRKVETVLMPYSGTVREAAKTLPEIAKQHGFAKLHRIYLAP